MNALRELSFALGLARGKPFQVLVQLTNRCNLRCSFCDFWPNGAPPDQELTLAEHQRLSDELRGLGRFIVSIEGGEPFLRPDLVEIVRAYARHHLPTLFTNGWYVTPANAAALFAAGLTQVGVSIDYPDAERHDQKRDLPEVFARAWRAVAALRDAAPHGGRQVHVMSVVMESNWRALEPLLEASAAAGVGHCLTLLSTGGHRRGQDGPDRLPPPEAARHLLRLWRRYPHLRFFSDYLRGMETFLRGGRIGTCRAGVQSFNIDHLGHVAPCIEKIDRPRGNVRQEPLAAIHARMSADRAEVSACNQCWTACRGFVQAIGGGGTLPAWVDLGTRMRSR